MAWIEVGAKSNNPIVWKTCNEIQVFVNTGGSPNAVDDVQFVIDYLNSLGTLNFQYAGTNEKNLIASGFKSNYQVQITYGARESFLKDWNNEAAIAVGGSFHFDKTYSSGQIAAYLPAMDDANQDLRRNVILHEFGHVLGLAHTTTEGDIMYPISTSDAATSFNQEVVDYFANNPGCVK